jgi:glucosylceramidase
LSLSSGVPNTPNNIVVNEDDVYQQIDGFGGNFSDLTTYLMTNYMTSTQRSALMQNLFSQSNGAGISVIRTAMGANDQVFDKTYNENASTYDDNAGSADYSLAHFSISHDTPYAIPRIQDALSVSPGLRILGSAWWQPSWLVVTDNSTCGVGNGRTYVTVDPNHYSTYANMFVKYVQAYTSYNIPIWAVEPQNEPQCGGQTQQNIELPAASQNSFIKSYLYPAFQSNNISTGIIPNVDKYCNDTNVYTGYVNTILSDSTTLPEILGPSWHSYCQPSAASFLTTTRNSYPSTGIYESEVTYGSPYNWANLTGQGGGSADAVAVMRNWGKTFLFHAMANSSTGALGDCNATYCAPMFEIDTSTGNVSYLMEFYVLEHFSKFAKPGGYRIDSNQSGSIQNVAFKNPDGSKALVVANTDGTNAQTVGIQWGNQTFSYTLPANSLATFAWAAAHGQTVVPVDDSVIGTGTNQISYSGSGWGHCTNCDSPAIGRYNASNSWDSTANDSASMTFSGVGVNVYEVGGPGQGLVDVYIDGVFVQTVDGYRSANQGNLLLFSTTSLTSGAHTVKLVNEAKAGAGHSGTAFILDHIDVVEPSDTSVDDSVTGSGSNQFNYSGTGWGHCTSCDSPSIGRYNASNSWDSTAGDSATFAFTGTGINLYAVTGPSQGYASVWIDNFPATLINTYSPTSIGNQLVWGTQRLSSGSHTLHIKVTGTHAAFSGGNIVIVDRAEVVPAGAN